MTTSLHRSRVPLRDCRYCHLSFLQAASAPLSVTCFEYNPKLAGRRENSPGHLMPTLTPCHTPSHKTVCGIVQAAYCMPRPSLGL